jgi:hypothetical protein
MVQSWWLEDHRPKAPQRKDSSGLLELRRVVNRINPYLPEVLQRKPERLQPHQRDMLDKRQVPHDELGEPRQSLVRLLVEYDAQFDSHAASREIVEALERFVVRTLSLNDVVMSCLS